MTVTESNADRDDLTGETVTGPVALNGSILTLVRQTFKLALGPTPRSYSRY